MEDVEALRLNHKRNGIRQVKLILEQADKMKRNTYNHEAIIELQSSAKKMENNFK